MSVKESNAHKRRVKIKPLEKNALLYLHLSLILIEFPLCFIFPLKIISKVIDLKGHYKL